MAIPLHVDDDRVSEAHLPGGDRADGGLQRVERPAMPADEQTEVPAHYIKDDLALVALVLLDGRRVDSEVTENGLECPDGGVGDLVELLVREFRPRRTRR